MKKLFSLLIFTLAISISCREDDFDILPRITQEGLNTFGCLINGKLLSPTNGKGGIGGQGADGMIVYHRFDTTFNSIGEYIRPPYFAIRASDWTSRYGDLLYLYLADVPTIGVYDINTSNNIATSFISSPVSHALANVYDKEGGVRKFLSYYQSGQITITNFDSINAIVSGSFRFKMVDKETLKDTIEVEEGRFDIKWDTVNE